MILIILGVDSIQLIGIIKYNHRSSITCNYLHCFYYISDRERKVFPAISTIIGPIFQNPSKLSSYFCHCNKTSPFHRNCKISFRIERRIEKFKDLRACNTYPISTLQEFF